MDTNRDISIISLNTDQFLVIACDSLGGIGQKSQDEIKVTNKLVGKLTTRVALLEVLASGADPITVINTLSVELNPTGEEIITGIKEELKKLDMSNLLNGSSEENMATVQTGVGITVIGRVDRNRIKLFSSEPNDLVVSIGIPKVGKEVLEFQDEIVDLDLILKLLEVDYINEIIPVGSKGMLYEANLIADSNQLNLHLLDTNLNLEQSAGPATVILLTLEERNLNRLKKIVNQPLNVIGRLEKQNQ
ncbi:MAG: AIR synthase related protein [Bacillota bacterium]